MGRLIRIWKNYISGELSNFKKNEDYGTTEWVYDSETKIVYYKITEVTSVYSKNFDNQEPMDTKVGYMSPYISKNGKYCCFKENSIVEVG